MRGWYVQDTDVMASKIWLNVRSAQLNVGGSIRSWTVYPSRPGWVNGQMTEASSKRVPPRPRALSVAHAPHFPARTTASGPRLARLARKVWRSRTRSQSIPVSLSDSESVSPRKGDTASAVRKLGEGRLRGVVDRPGLSSSPGLFEE